MKIKSKILLSIVIFLSVSTAIAKSDPNINYTILAFPKDKNNSSIGYLKFDISKTIWNLIGEADISERMSEQFDTTNYSSNRVLPGYYYIVYTCLNKKGINRIYSATTKDLVAYKNDQERVYNEVDLGRCLLVDEGYNTPTINLPKRNGTQISIENFIADFSNENFTSITSSCDEKLMENENTSNNKTFNVKKVKNGLLLITKPDGSAMKIDMTKIIKPAVNAEEFERQKNKFRKTWVATLNSLCSEPIKKDSSIVQKLNGTFNRFHMNFLQEKKKECEKIKMQSKECDFLKPKKTNNSSGVRG